MKEVRVIENSVIPRLLSWFIKIHAITIYPFIICRTELDKQTRTHEYIHIAQQKELWLVGFYFLYAWFWLKNIVWKRMYFSKAYQYIPFELEAYHNDHKDIYPLTREKFGWKKWT